MATVYDRFMDSAPYAQWASFTKEVLDQIKPDAKTVIDLGCGTGTLTLRLAAEGYQMTGVDFASDMLTIAAQHAADEGTQVQWIHQDLTTLDVGKAFDVAVSYCDVINYITTESDIKSVFENAYKSLTDDGVFIFDVHAISYAENVLTDNLFSEIDEDMGYVWFCEPGEHIGEMHHDMTFFVKDKEQYERFDEQHYQRTFHTATYLAWLKDVGFEKVTICADFNPTMITAEQADESERVFIICKK